jgi:hypothetical protein
MAPRFVVPVLLVAAVACTGAPASPIPPEILSPAFPADCGRAIVRADDVDAEDLPAQVDGHLPTWLPSGFGLSGSWQAEHGDPTTGGSATWTDGRCRSIQLSYFGPRSSVTLSGPKVGAWTVIADTTGGCSVKELGIGRCVVYTAFVDDHRLNVETIGLEREEGDRIVGSIPL